MGNLFSGWLRYGSMVDSLSRSERRENLREADALRSTLQDEDLRDQRIAIEWEGFTEDEAANPGNWDNERFTTRSITRTKAILEQGLMGLPIQPIQEYTEEGAANPNHYPDWFLNRINTNRLPRVQEVEVTVGGTNISTQGLWMNPIISVIEYIEEIAKNSLVMRQALREFTTESRLPADATLEQIKAAIDAYNEEYGQDTNWMGRARGDAPVSTAGRETGNIIPTIPELYTMSTEALNQRSKAHLKSWMDEHISAYIGAEHGGRNIIENYGAVDAISRAIGNKFRNSAVDLDLALHDEAQLLADMRNYFIYLYYTYIVTEDLSIDQLEDALILGLGTSDDATAVLWSRVSSTSPQPDRVNLNSLVSYVRTFGELIFRIRVNEAILEFEDELPAAVAVGAHDDVVGEEGLRYSDQINAVRRRRATEIMNEEFGREDDQEQSAEEDARLQRLAEQCFLTDFLPTLARNSQQRHTTVGHTFSTFTALHGNTDTMINKLIYNPAMNVMDLLTPAELSSLVPKIRLYKIVYDVDEYGLGRSYEQEVPFEAHITEGEVSAMLSSPRERGRGAGIVSFDWTLDGMNPFAARRYINANLKLFFQSMESFLAETALPAVDAAEGDSDAEAIKRFPFRYVDLVNTGMVERLPSLGWNPDYFKLKAEVGWVASNLDVFTGDQQTIIDKKRAIEETRMSFFMTATEHEIDVNEQGNLNLSIEYTAWQEASLSDSNSDILATARTLRTRALRRTRIERQLEEDPCNTRVFAEIEEAYKMIAEEENYTAWQRLLNHMGEKGNIFVTSVSERMMREYQRALDPEAVSTEGLVERLFGKLEEPAEPDLTLVSLENSNANTAAMTQAISTRRTAEDQTILQRIQGLTWNESGDNIQVQYFFFGDLMEAALSLITSDLAAADETDGTTAMTQGKRNQDMRILLGPLTFMDTRSAVESDSQQLVYDVNLADVPISVHYFIEWFLKDVIGEQRTFYPCMEFIKNATNTLIEPIITQHCTSLPGVERQPLQLRTSFLSARAMAAESRENALIDPLEGYKNILNNRRVDVDKAYDDVQPPEGSGRLLYSPLAGEAAYHYLLIYTIASPSLGGLNGDFLEDQLRGIYHFGIGKNKGILKKVQFKKADFNLREARIERELLQSATGLAILANVYDITVTMFGNTLFMPGSLIYVDPSGLGQIGLPTDPNSASRMLGIGGYHKVYNVKSYIESGKYETTLQAIWEAPGDAPPTIGMNRFERIARRAATGTDGTRCPDGTRPRSLLDRDSRS